MISHLSHLFSTGCCGPRDFTLVPHLFSILPHDFHLSPTLVSRSVCSGPHAFTFVSHLSPTLVSRSGFTLVSRLFPAFVSFPALGALGRMLLGPVTLHLSPTCFPRLSPRPHDFTLVSHFSPSLCVSRSGCFGRLILQVSLAERTSTPLRYSKSHACHAKAAPETKKRQSVHQPPCGAASRTPAAQEQRQSGGDPK